MKTYLAALVIGVSGSFAHAETPSQFLNRWKQNPIEVASEQPKHFKTLGARRGFYGNTNPELKDMCRISRERIMEGLAFNRRSAAPVRGNDRAETLLPTEHRGIFSNSLDNQPTVGTVAVAPWSDHYWPLYAGALAQRYNDNGFQHILMRDQNGETWKTLNEYILKNPASEAIKNDADFLSPAEKWDALLGLMSAPVNLSTRMWDEGRPYFDRDKKVETWMGLCHGVAAASIMERRPLKTVSTLSDSGAERLNLYPTDIKGLLTLIWARTPYDSRFVGGRCNVKDPEVDPETGRIKAPECFDINPATLHFALTHLVGKLKQSFVMDANFDYEVWNYPVHSYSIDFHHPSTMKLYRNWQQAMMPLCLRQGDDRVNCERGTYFDDPFWKYRSPQARYVVGVATNVRYVSGGYPSSTPTDSEIMDPRGSVTYYYDLELDENYRVVGGEWKQNGHPDFLWIPNDFGQLPWEQRLTGQWSSPEHRMPAEWNNMAKRAAIDQWRSGEAVAIPLPKVVRSLVDFAQ